jgi:hypothetical protein
MSIDYSAILKDLLTWASAAKVAGGAFIHKAWQWIVAKAKAAEAEAAKVAADVKKDV